MKKGLIIIVVFIIMLFMILYKDTFLSSLNLSESYNSYDSTIPKNIWLFWNDPINEKSPFSIRLCYDILTKQSQGYNVVVLNLNNYKKYVTDNRIIKLVDSGKLTYTQISDVLRLYVIYKYGGIYLDASIILLDSLDWVYKYNKMGYNLIIYKNTGHTQPSEYKTPVLENWFIAASPNNEFLGLSLNKLVEIFEKQDLNKELQKLLSNKDVNYQNFSTHGTYHMAYFVFIYILYKYYRNGIKNSLFLECTPDPNKLVCSFIPYYGKKNEAHLSLFTKPITEYEYNIIKDEKMVKLISINRKDIDNATIVPNSFIDRLLKNLDIKYTSDKYTVMLRCVKIL